MPNYIVDPNVGFLNPVAGVDGGIGVAPAGFDYATLISSALTALGNVGHTGAPGDGKQIVTAAININGDLTFNSYNATNLRSSRFINNASTLAGTSDLLELYVYNNNLYYNNASGVAIQITNGSSIVSGGASGNSLLYAYLAVSANHTILSTDAYTFFDCHTASTAITLTLPSASAMAAGTYYIIKDADGAAASNNITVVAAAGNYVDAASGSYLIKQAYGCVVLITDGSSNWRVERLDALSLNGVTISGTPSVGNVLVASNSSLATWAAPTVISGVTVSGTPTTGYVLTATSASAANWQASAGGAGGFTAGGDLTGTSTSQQVASATGSGGIFNISAAEVTNLIAANVGTTTKLVQVTTTSTSVSTTTLLAIPSGSSGRVDVTITGRNGANSVNQTWSGKVVNNGGTLTVFKAFAPSDAMDFNGTNPVSTISVQNSGANITVSVTPSGTTSTNFSYAISYVSSA